MNQITIYWRDIPSQVLIRKGRQKAKKQLSPRFQEAIDRAAMRAGKGSSDAYLEEWRRVTIEIAAETDLEAVAAAQVQDIESRYTDDELETLIRNKGSAATSSETEGRETIE